MVVWYRLLLLLAYTLSTIVLSKSEECGVDVGCWEIPGLNYAVYYKKLSDDRVYINITLTDHSSDDSSSAYIGLAFSHDELMGDDEAMACMISQSNEAKLQHSRNVVVYVQDNIPTRGELLEQVVTHYDPMRQTVTCSFVRPITVEGDDDYFDLTNKYFLLAATGKVDRFISGHLNEHALHSSMVSESKIDLLMYSEVNSAGKPEPTVAITGHAIMQIFAWCVFMPIAVFTGRFYKPFFTQVFVANKPKWFVLHTGLNLFTFVFCVFGLGMSFYHENYAFVFDVHQISGMVLFFALIVQLLIGLLRPDPDTRWRPVFVWFHRIIGFLIALAAIWVIYSGINMFRMKYDTDLATYFIFILMVVCIFAFFLFAFGFSKRLEKEKTGSASKYMVDTNTISGDNITDEIKTSSKLGMMVKVHYAFSITVFLFAATIILDLIFRFTAKKW